MQNLSDRLLGSRNEKYYHALEEIKRECNTFFVQNKKYSSRFGAEFSDHCQSIERATNKIIGETHFGDQQEYVDTCHFILGAVAWIHPIRTFSYGKRDFESELYAALNTIFKNYEIDKLVFTLIKDIVESPQHHINSCIDMTHIIENNKYSIKLLLSYFHLAYKFHIDNVLFSHEFSMNDLAEIFIQPDDKVSKDLKIQWLKAIFIADNIFYDRVKKCVEITLNIPSEWDEDSEFQKYLKGDILESIIKTDLYEAISKVSEFFIRNSNNAVGNEVASSHLNNIFLDIKISYGPLPKDPNHSGKYKLGNTFVDQSFLKQILFNAALLIYPNASKLVDIATRNIQRITTLTDELFEEYKDRSNRIKEFLRFMDRIIATRPCHASLIIIKDILEQRVDYFKAYEDDTIERYRDFIHDIDVVMSNFTKGRYSKLKALVNNSLPLLTDGGSILLYGNSDTISESLATAINANEGVKRTPIIICECRNKAMYNYDNSFGYCDGIEYFKKISSIGYENISIVSEASLGNLFSEPNLINKVCLGANGIDLSNGNCVHSLGHLLVSEIANTYKVPVYIFADTYKFYQISPKPFEIMRENCWLEGKDLLVNQLMREKLFEKRADSDIEDIYNKYNRREDVIPKELVTAFVTDKGITSGTQLESLMIMLSVEISAIVGAKINHREITPEY